jgi:cytochrome c
MRTLILAVLMAIASAGLALAQDAAAGQQVFTRWCLPCHDAGEGAKIKLGPPLNGLDGRKAGTWEGYNYSDATRDCGITWGEVVFKEYVDSPLQKIPGTRMTFAGLRSPKDRDDLWAYLSRLDREGKKK